MSNTPPPASIVPRIGVAVFIIHPVPAATTGSTPSTPLQRLQCKFLLGRRLGSHGANTWALPGGHLEHGESFEECAMRETREETGLEIERVEFLTATNDLMPSSKGDGALLHYATVFMVARVKGSYEAISDTERHGDGGAIDIGMPDVKVMEPNKCAGWEWVSWTDLIRWSAWRLSPDSAAEMFKSRGPAAAAAAAPAAATTTTQETDLQNDCAREDEGDDGEGKHGRRQLFTPMLNLITQRPGVVPHIVDHYAPSSGGQKVEAVRWEV
ncbi:uncharacterized protein A1O9_07889 [Exophiala aquamarina CBS 119918]|uniref:Nudix hydrolase domain-containing protein n=1 Tax=Exophiala aquamarina CBS 119918 TaxID=1182545 RepID=A0A072PAM9_9EURO|nr:uncharacterized protein A1O9_07889 [Exophiala aquamarina CBS 119918]KEF56308.1 hypothetical protein A1O9_07889 [Exophiala aquamarina CBS 119918]